MRVGFLQTSHPDPATEPYPHQAVHARVTREVLEAEELGFDAVWIAEHHFSNRYGILPDPFSYLAYAAAGFLHLRHDDADNIGLPRRRREVRNSRAAGSDPNVADA